MPPTFITEPVFPGLQGIDLKRAIDQVEATRLVRMTNLTRPKEGELTGRPGLTELFSLEVSPNKIQSIKKLMIPVNMGIDGDYDYFVLADGVLYASIDGAVPSLIEGDFGDDVVFSVYHPANSGGSWLVLTSTSKSRKVQVGTHLSMPLGLPKPDPFSTLRFRIDEFSAESDGSLGSLDRARWTEFGFSITGTTGSGAASVFTSYGPLNKTAIDTFESTSGWTPNAGTGAAPTLTTDTTDFKEGTAALKFTTAKGAATTRYYNHAIKVMNLDLSTVGGGPATDDDVIHIWLKTDRPDKVEEIRVYFIVDSTCDTATLPGTSATLNNEAYVKAFRPSDFSGVVFGSTGTQAAATTAATNITTTKQLKGKKDKRQSTVLQQAQLEETRWSAVDMMLGSAWQEIGVIGFPLHRGEFRRIGGDADRDWADVTGVCLAVQITDNTDAINVWFDDAYLTGGAGLDSTALGMQPFDYRVTNYDPRTGAQSNPSDIQGAGYRLDSIRRSIVVTPPVYGNPNIRQKFWRRGGSLVNNWYYIGQNNEDGGAFTDIYGDSEIATQGTVEIDNDQPVTTEDSNGDLVYAQDLPAIFGPVADLMFGCGDPYRRGYLYWCKPNNIDSWPSTFFSEVCPDSEELMNGSVLAGNAYVFSRERMFAVIPNLSNVAVVGTVPTACTHGLAARNGLCNAYGAMWFVSEDGVYRTAGGPEESITEDLLRPLFHGETRNGYYPIDFTRPEDIALEAHNNEIWLTFRDTNGAYQTWIFDTLYRFWRHYSFTPQVTAVHSDMTGTNQLLAGGRSSPKIFTHSGTSDDSAAIVARGTGPSMDQQQPRQDKLYGDIVVDVNRNSNTVTVTPLYENESSTGTPVLLTTGSGRDRYYAATGTTQAQNCAIDFQWSTTSTAPVLYRLGLSISPQTDTTVSRVTDWESGGRLSDKQIKGIVFECDTGGLDKTIEILADGVVQQTITVNASGRQVVEKSWPQFVGRLLRMRPTDSNEWKLYSYSWIFDQEPLSLTRWETQPLTHNIPGWHSLLFGHIMVKSSADVTLTITGYRQDGTTFSDAYTLTNTSGVPVKRFLGFNARKAIAWKYLFTSASAFWLYREETDIWVQPWTGAPTIAKPFGSDDLDLTRSLNDAAFIADKSGWNVDSPTSKAPVSQE